jgi:hypothetical protein
MGSHCGTLAPAVRAAWAVPASCAAPAARSLGGRTTAAVAPWWCAQRGRGRGRPRPGRPRRALGPPATCTRPPTGRTRPHPPTWALSPRCPDRRHRPGRRRRRTACTSPSSSRPGSPMTAAHTTRWGRAPVPPWLAAPGLVHLMLLVLGRLVREGTGHPWCWHASDAFAATYNPPFYALIPPLPPPFPLPCASTGVARKGGGGRGGRGHAP